MFFIVNTQAGAVSIEDVESVHNSTNNYSEIKGELKKPNYDLYGAGITGSVVAEICVDETLNGGLGDAVADDGGLNSEGLRPVTAAAKAELQSQFSGIFIGGYRSGPGAQDHALGLALDISSTEAGLGVKLAPGINGYDVLNNVYTWLVQNRVELRIKYIIWQQQIENVNVDSWRRRPMEDRGNVTKNHYDHIHVSFLDNDSIPNCASLVTGDGSCSSGVTPKINSASNLSNAIDQYISKTAPSSPFIGMGSSFVEGAQRAGVNPILLVVIAQKESSLGTRTPAGSFNAFGRKASSTQPSVSAKGSDWYKYQSWRDSLNGLASGEYDQAQYLKDVYVGQGLTSVVDIMMKYAPPTDGNDTVQYINQINAWSSSIASLAGDAVECGGATQQPDATNEDLVAAP